MTSHHDFESIIANLKLYHASLNTSTPDVCRDQIQHYAVFFPRDKIGWYEKGGYRN